MSKKFILSLGIIVILMGSLTSCRLWLRGTPTAEPAPSPTVETRPPTSTPMPAQPTATPPLTATPQPPIPTNTPVPSPTSTRPSPTIRVIADVLNVREKPTTESPIITKLSQGTMLPTLGRNLAGDWLLIVLSDGTQGWVSAQWVETSVPTQTLPIAEAVTPTPTPQPATPTPTVTTTPEATPTLLPAPVLLEPQHEQVFDARGPGQLKWSWQGVLASDQFFVVIIAYPHDQAIWHDIHWVKETSFTPPAYLKDLITGNRRCEWHVVVKRQTGTDAQGMKVGEAVSQPSAVRAFVWGE